MVLNQTDAYDLLVNGSLFKAVDVSYRVAWGDWFYPLIFFVSLVMVYMKTESPAMVFIASAVLTVIMKPFVGQTFFSVFFLISALCLAFTLYSFYGKADSMP